MSVFEDPGIEYKRRKLNFFNISNNNPHKFVLQCLSYPSLDTKLKINPKILVILFGELRDLYANGVSNKNI